MPYASVSARTRSSPSAETVMAASASMRRRLSSPPGACSTSVDSARTATVARVFPASQSGISIS